MTPSGDDTPGRHRMQPIIEAVYAPGRYGLVVLLILLTYALSVSLTQSWGASVVLAVQIATVWLILRTSEARRGLQLVADIALVIAIVAAILGLFLHRETSQRILPAISGMLYVVAPFSIGRHLVRRRTIDGETVLGALATYLLIGMSFAFIYRTVGANQSGPFFGSQGEGSVPEDLFFSFTTLTTTGYGNLVPADNPGQSLAVAEMLIGQLFLVTAVAKVVNSFRPARRPGNPPESDDTP
ncbi:ion channel [Jatrophihabitans sp. GAS493]|uniref:ion channel n=1 Tax=Jatrophihabitans sp. GAS493 TaxID=1907575 RepID=UPI000BB85002|nr:ion channel [Jatrophihabitans sp. GAS493]SOD74902.1 ion channel [Jatrophihabitans sp. GAS493]